MPNYYCNVLGDNVISEGEYSQERLHGETGLHLRLGQVEEKVSQHREERLHE